MPKGLRQQAERLVGDAARPALDLVDYDPAVQPAMYHAFGRTFICKVGATAESGVRDLCPMHRMAGVMNMAMKRAAPEAQLRASQMSPSKS